MARRKERERERQLVEIARMRDSMTAQQIADVLPGELSRQTIYNDFAELDRRLIAQQCDNTEARRQRIMGSLMRIRREARKGWERSLENKERHEDTSDEKGCGTKDVSEGQSGNPAFLTVEHATYDTEAKLYGAYAPTKTAMTDPDGNGVPFTVTVPADWGKIQVDAQDEAADSAQPEA